MEQSDFKFKNPLLEFVDDNSELGFKVPDISMFGMLKISEKSHPDALAYEYFGTKSSYKMQFVK